MGHRFKLAALGVALLLAGLWAGAKAESGRPADFNGNGGVDSDDLFDFAYYFDLKRGDLIFETEGYRADFDQNGRVDELDLFYFSSRWHRD